MKKKLFILTAIILLITANKAMTADFYPEMGLDPFSSELNPEFMDANTATGEFELKKFIKNKLQERKNKKELKKKNKSVQNKNANEVKSKKETNFIDTNNSIKNEYSDGSVDSAEKKGNGVVTFSKEGAAEYDTELEQNETEEKNIIYNKEAEQTVNPVKKAVDETFVAKPVKKKHLTKSQLARELEKEEREQIKEIEKKQNITLKDRIFGTKKTNTQNKKNYNPPENPNINISADFMEYFPDLYEIHATGNAKVVFQAQQAKIEADKIVYDYDKNIIRANDNVYLTSKESVTEGDFINIDLSKPNGWIENPATVSQDIKINAKDAYIYSDNITEYDGSAKILRDDVLSIGARSFASYVDQSGILDTKKSKLSNEYKGIYKIKAKTIIIDSKDSHDIITIKNAGIYLKNHKIAVIPTLKVVSNKAHNNVETNIPEFGSQSMLGMHFGPAVVLNVPGGSTLKLAPILTYGDHDFGIGGIARFRSETNMTEVAYGTSKKHLIVRGRQKLAPGFTLNYSKYSNISEWFLGYRMPKYAATLNYNRRDYVKDLGLTFSQTYSAGLFVDNKRNYDFSNNHARFRWMTQTYKPLFKYSNKEGNVGLQIGAVAQTSATVYSQGNTVGLFRIGPSLKTQVGRWNQSIMYYQTATAGYSPFEFDRYRYGKSNLVLIESVKVCKYLNVGYLASVAMHNKYRNDNNHDDDLLQENRFFVSVGPEYAKITLGYDSVRHTTMMFLTLMIGTKDSDIEFKKTIINNPNKFGKETKKKDKSKKKSYKKYKKDLDELYKQKR